MAVCTPQIVPIVPTERVTMSLTAKIILIFVCVIGCVWTLFHVGPIGEMFAMLGFGSVALVVALLPRRRHS